MRYFVNIVTSGGSPAITVHAGSLLAQRIAKNLRTFRVWTGFDYEAFSISGLSVAGTKTFDSSQLADAIYTSNRSVSLDRVRVLVTGAPVGGKVGDHGLGLLIGVGEGRSFAWNPATGPMQATITITQQDEAQRAAAMLDIFQEIMIANCSSIQSVLRKYLADGHTIDDFYREKADYVTAEGLRSRIVEFAGCDAYMSFSTLVRRNLRGKLVIDEARDLGAVWQRFLTQRMPKYFLTTSEAIDLVRNGYFHDTMDFNRKRHQYLSASDLEEVLGDRQTVSKQGSYILCVRSRNPQPGDADLAAARFGRTGSRINRLRLYDTHRYSEMRTLVEHGVVTPIRLFLERP